MRTPSLSEEYSSGTYRFECVDEGYIARLSRSRLIMNMLRKSGASIEMSGQNEGSA